MFRIEHKGKVHVFSKDQLDRNQFMDKCWFLVKNETIHDVEIYADIWIAHKYYGAVYDEKIMKVIKQLAANLHV